MMNHEERTLGDWLAACVFERMESVTVFPESDGVKGFEEYVKAYGNGLEAEKRLGETVCWNN